MTHVFDRLSDDIFDVLLFLVSRLLSSRSTRVKVVMVVAARVARGVRLTVLVTSLAVSNVHHVFNDRLHINIELQTEVDQVIDLR